MRKLSVSSLQDFTLPITKGSFIFNEMAMRRTNCYCRGSEGLIRYWAGPVLVGWSVSSCVDAGMLELSVLTRLTRLPMANGTKNEHIMCSKKDTPYMYHGVTLPTT